MHKTEFVDSNLKFAKQMTKKKNSVQNLMTELELYTVFVSHNLVHKTEFVDNNLEFAYEMTMELMINFEGNYTPYGTSPCTVVSWLICSLFGQTSTELRLNNFTYLCIAYRKSRLRDKEN